jgi:hypothetical protein
MKDMQIKTTLRFYLIPVKVAAIKKTKNNKCEDAGEKNPHTLLLGMQTSAVTMEGGIEAP